jgi:predicted Zn-dependent protease with MMP-like domain
MAPMDETAFEELVEEAVASIPDVFLEMLDNVAIIVEDWPDRETMRLARVGSHYQLLGFYHGIPKTGRNSGYNLVAPDRISIYRRPIEAQCRSEEELREMVRRVVLHELAHHFGIDDDRLHEIGAY